MFTLIKNDKVSLMTNNMVIPKAEMPHLETLFDAGEQLTEALDSVEKKLRVSALV